MAVTTSSPPFLEPFYALDGTPPVYLTPVTVREATALGTMVARMPPWLGYPGMSAAGLTSFLAQEEPGTPRFAVHSDGDLAGTMTVRTNWFRGPYIQLLALAPTAQRTGLGSRLLDFVEAEARRDRQRQIWVAATATNHGALRFYERHGFVRTAEIDGLVADGIVECLLRKRLTYSDVGGLTLDRDAQPLGQSE
ncbi:MAG: GNAT family N-acetyltransferase [Hyphomicrobiaceae bacterium]|nr:GNAT family N-acetyltransferase [Hyphomicrobiaceae bacterium]